MRRSLFLALAGAPLLFLTQYAILRAADPTLSSVAPMSAPSADFNHHLIQPAGRAFLTSRVLLHSAYQVAQLPEDAIDFDDATKVLPLLVAIKPTGPCVFSIAARPAYGDGAAAQWLEFMVRHEGYEHGPVTRTQVGIYPAVTCDARQVTEDGLGMQMRFVLLEDGGRMVILNGMAPAEFWTAAEQQLMTMVNSFEFQQDQGTKVALFPGEEPPSAGPAPSSPAPADTSTAAAEEAPSSRVGASPTEGQPAARLTADEFAALVLADDASSFDQEVGINANLRDRGIGFVPRVLGVDAQEKSVRLGAGAIEAVIRLPFGWHALDDGRRTLVFDAENRIQINLDLRPWSGEPLVDYARAFVAPYLENEPELPVAALEFEGGIAGAGVQGANIDGERLDQVFLVRRTGREGYALVARVTAAGGDDSIRALNLAGDILARIETAAEFAAAVR